MITASNYFKEMERIGVHTLPETLKKGHDFVVKSTQGGTDWSGYDNSPNIKKVIELYFQKLSDYIGSISKGPKTKSKVAAPIRIKSTQKAEHENNYNVFKKAYTLLTKFLSGIDNSLVTEISGTVKLKGAKQREVYFNLEPGTEYHSLTLTASLKEKQIVQYEESRILQYEANIYPNKMEAIVTADWIGSDYRDKYGHAGYEDIDDESDETIDELMTSSMNQWLEDVLGEGNKIMLTDYKKAKSKLTKPKEPKKHNMNKKAAYEKKQSNDSAKKVEHIREEVKFIKRFVGLHDKVKSPASILSLLKSLQRAIVQKLIRKTSPLAKEIQLIQDRLIGLVNKMKGDTLFTINSKDELHRLVAIAGGEKVYPSINLIKRFVSLQGKPVGNPSVERYLKQIEHSFEKKKVAENDPYINKVKSIYKALKKSSGSIVTVSKAELSGLEGIVEGCSCKKSLGNIYKIKEKISSPLLKECHRKFSYSDSKGKGTCSHHRGVSGMNGGLNGVLTAEQMANRKLDVLRFFSIWLSLFGNPAKNFVMMFHGEPHNGKTILLLKFAQFLAEHFGKVIYISSEEFSSTTMSSKVSELLKPFPSRLSFFGSLQNIDLSQYDFIILDSVNDLGLKVNDYKALREQYPDKAFILILQHTKSGTFKGGKDWEHIPEIVGEVEKGVITITKNRYGPKNVFDFFKYFDLQWEEPGQNLVSTPKPHPVEGDMTTWDNNHY